MDKSLETPAPGAEGMNTSICLRGHSCTVRLLSWKGAHNSLYNSSSGWNPTIPYTSPAPAPEAFSSTRIESFATHIGTTG